MIEMITKTDKERISLIKKYIDEKAFLDNNKMDWEKIEWIETLDRILNILKIAPMSFKPCSPEDLKDNYYLASCDKCNWWGSSKLLDGGYAIADTGDYLDACCPICGNNDIDEKK